jgi:FkbM family methyltransferase
LGFDLHSLPVDSLTLRDLEFDLCRLIKNSKPVVVDVGANTGQTIDPLRRTLDRPRIFSFEPNPTLAIGLKQKYSACDVVVEAIAVGSSEGQCTLNVLENDELSSILKLTRNEAPSVSSVVSVPITTIDLHAERLNLAHIDLLKIDTQGFDLDVLRGTAQMLYRRAVDTLLVEVNFITLYEGSKQLWRN